LFLTDNAAVTHGWKLGEIGDHYTNGDDYKVELAGFLSNNKIIVKGKSYDNPGKLGNKFYGTLSFDTVIKEFEKPKNSQMGGKRKRRTNSKTKKVSKGSTKRKSKKSTKKTIKKVSRGSAKRKVGK